MIAILVFWIIISSIIYCLSAISHHKQLTNNISKSIITSIENYFNYDVYICDSKEQILERKITCYINNSFKDLETIICFVQFKVDTTNLTINDIVVTDFCFTCETNTELIDMIHTQIKDIVNPHFESKSKTYNLLLEFKKHKI